MATLYFCVWDDAKEVALGIHIQEDTVAISGTSAQSAAIAGISGRTKHVRIFVDADCYVTWGENPTALGDGTDGRPMVANDHEYFSIPTGHRIAVIQRV